MSDETMHLSYKSPFAWRYGSEPMRGVWGEVNKRTIMRKVWWAAAVAMHDSPQNERHLQAIERGIGSINLDRSFEIEKEVHHDVVAELYAFCEHVGPTPASLLHTGMTSSDVVDNVEALRVRASAKMIIEQLKSVMLVLGNLAFDYAGTEVVGYTHLQEAQRTTQGHRFALYLQDFHGDYLHGLSLRSRIRGKGLKGAVGSYEPATTMGYNPRIVENNFSGILDLPLWPLANQTSPRKQTVEVVQWLSNICLSAYRVAQDLRLLASPLSGGIWTERTRDGYVGSSAMPHKKNPITEEKICSLARWVQSQVGVAWHNAAANMLERTLDDSANTRIMLPSVFLATNEVLAALYYVLCDGELDRSKAWGVMEDSVDAAMILSLLQAELIVRGSGQRQTRNALRRLADAYHAAQIDPRITVEQNKWVAEYMTTQEIRRLFRTWEDQGTTRWLPVGEDEEVEIFSFLGLTPLVESIIKYLQSIGGEGFDPWT